MIVVHVLISLLIGLIVIIPIFVLSWPIVAVLLLTSWDGKSTIFGNAKWGRATMHPIHPTKEYKQQLLWLCWRNPVNNLMTKYLSVSSDLPVITKGDTTIGDHTHGGHYSARLGKFWEYYCVLPYTKTRCFRARIGWKLVNADKPAAYCFAINPVHAFG